jgi:predicted DNA-binding protein (MmcQ/YjbR family)
MHLDEFYAYCINLPGVEVTTPFGPEVLVFKVMGKMFALTAPEDLPPKVNLKCDPERAIELRDKYDSIQPGYHMNKKHWNTLTLEAGIPTALVRELTQHSYDLVVATLSKKSRAELGR